jgi:Kef-type K+ transport system membrane component KefB
MDSGMLTSVLVIAFMVVLAPLIADQLSRWVTVPTVVLEIGLGILAGPAVLGLAQPDDVVEALANLGLAMLFLLAGYEVNAERLRGSPLNRALLSWVGSLLLGLLLGALLAAVLGGGAIAALAIGLALATTALGTILPAVRDAGLLPTPLGTRILTVGAVGEFVPIVAIAILLSGGRPAHASLLLVTFAAVAIVTIGLATRQLPDRLRRLLSTTLGTSAQFAVRLSILVVLALVWLAVELHLDLVLGAFAAGVVMRQLLTSISRREAEVVESKLEGIGYGVLIPFFFVTTGVRFDLAALLGSTAALALVPVGLVGFLLVRGLPVGFAFRHQLPRRELISLSLYAATALPLVIVVSDLSVANGWLSPASAAGLVGAAMLSVLACPLAAQRVLEPAATPAK